jgi:hypothetical protein
MTKFKTLALMATAAALMVPAAALAQAAPYQNTAPNGYNRNAPVTAPAPQAPYTAQTPQHGMAPAPPAPANDRWSNDRGPGERQMDHHFDREHRMDMRGAVEDFRHDLFQTRDMTRELADHHRIGRREAGRFLWKLDELKRRADVQGRDLSPRDLQHLRLQLDDLRARLRAHSR